MSNRFTVDLVILCDDVREEITGKHTLIGVYNNSIIVEANLENVVLPMAFFIRGRFKNSESITIEMWIEDPGGKRTQTSSLSELTPPLKTNKSSPPAIIEWKVVPWRARDRGVYKLHLKQDDSDAVILNFLLGDMPT